MGFTGHATHHVAASQTAFPRQGGEDCPLTRLDGLGSFYRRGIPIVEKCLADGVPCAMALLAVDHFHRLGEIRGRDASDAALKMIAQHLRHFGYPHLSARLAEDEFALLLVGQDGDAAAATCERFRQAIASDTISTTGGSVALTVSIGVAEVYGSETFDNYLNAAEQFLFMAQNNGRNQVLSDHSMVGVM
jgi:diguanylate cyclase (GGDEF)-like protein